VLPDAASGGQHLLTQVGKTGRVYVLNQDNLGGYNPNNTTDPEEKAYVLGMFGMPTYWNGNLYFWSVSDNLKAYSFLNGVLSATPTSTSVESVPFPGATPTVSSNGATNGVVWDIRSDAFASEGREILYAHDATNVAILLYSSEQNVARDNPGNAVKFTVPTVINGKVYVGAEYLVSVFGLLNGQAQAAAPVLSPGSSLFNPSVQVSITDSTPGVQIFYTTDGSLPTTASTLYTGPITVTSNETIQAFAAGTGFLESLVATATYTFQTQVLTPTFTPAPGEYASAQSVTIATTPVGATIYYTTDGSTPSTASTVYIGPVPITASSTLSAFAAAPNLSNSPVASGAYVINQNAISSVNFGSGFTAGGMVMNGAKLSGTRLRLSDGVGQANSAWYATPANVQTFTTDFSFQITPGTNPTADGFTFVIQGNSTSAVDTWGGGGLGYGPDTPGGTPGIPKSVAVKFDLFNNAGEGVNSTGIYTNGASPTTPFVDLTNTAINLHSGDIFNVHMTYDGSNLVMTITDATTNGAFTQSWPIDIPGTVGGNTAYVGFTAATGGLTAIQEILNWTYVSNGGGQPAAATPAFSLAAGPYLGTQTVGISDTTPGATIFYTLDGTTPATSAGGSTQQYNSAITVSSTETINAIAVASGYATSAMGSATYTIETQVAAPTFSLGAGTYTSAQQVTISTATSGATIYYTTNGTAPTTSSTPYTGPITVSTSETVEAMAAESGFFDSNVSTAVYTITPPTATPVIVPGTGTFTTAQTVSITDGTAGATIYYTLDGSQPTTSSAQYTVSFSVSATTTVQAIATAPNFTTSGTATSVITIQGSSTTVVNFGSGFTAGGMVMNYSAKLNGTRLRLTDRGTREAGSAWYPTPASVQTFTTDFSFQITNPTADGFTFAIQGNNTSAIDLWGGGGLGYGPGSLGGPLGIAKSVAVKFDLYNNVGEGVNSTGIYTNGASPTTPFVDLTNTAINLHSGDIFNVHMTYDGSNLVMTITDATTNGTFTQSWPINIPATVGGNTAYVGFTAATGGGGLTAIQDILNWTYVSN